ncbi:MAG: YciI family protein [Labilithrix sp.]
MKFMLMMNAPKGGDGEWNVMKWPMEDLKAHIGFMKQLNADLRKEGTLVGAEGLAAPAQARIVRAGASGAPEVTDGPFAESKEFLAGYWIVDVETAEHAYAIAARASAAPGKGGKPLGIPIEVREVMASAPIEV